MQDCGAEHDAFSKEISCKSEVVCSCKCTRYLNFQQCNPICDWILEKCRPMHTTLKLTFHHERKATPIHYTFALQPCLYFAFYEWICTTGVSYWEHNGTLEWHWPAGAQSYRCELSWAVAQTISKCTSFTLIDAGSINGSILRLETIYDPLHHFLFIYQLP